MIPQETRPRLISGITVRITPTMNIFLAFLESRSRITTHASIPPIKPRKIGNRYHALETLSLNGLVLVVVSFCFGNTGFEQCEQY